MTSTNDAEVFREKWHDHLEGVNGLRHTLHPDRWDELDEHLDALHDLVDDAADELEDEE